MARPLATASPGGVVIVTAPRAEAHADYRGGRMVRDQEIRKYKRVRLFVLTTKVIDRLSWAGASATNPSASGAT